MSYYDNSKDSSCDCEQCQWDEEDQETLLEAIEELETIPAVLREVVFTDDEAIAIASAGGYEAIGRAFYDAVRRHVHEEIERHSLDTGLSEGAAAASLVEIMKG